MTPEREQSSPRELQIFKLDALVVLGINIIPGGFTREEIREQPDFLSPLSRLNALAAGELYKMGIAQRIIFSSGHTAGKDIPSEAQAMKDFLKKRFPEIPDEAIILEEKSIDTSSNAQEVGKIIKERGFTNVGLLTIGPHAKNAWLLFQRHGVKIDWSDVFESEGELAKRARDDEEFLRALAKTKPYRKMEQIERFRGLLLHTIDRKGKLLHWLASSLLLSTL